jgi:hypothetical protein
LTNYYLFCFKKWQQQKTSIGKRKLITHDAALARLKEGNTRKKKKSTHHCKAEMKKVPPSRSPF